MVFIMNKMRLGAVATITLSSALVSPLVYASELETPKHLVGVGDLESVVKSVAEEDSTTSKDSVTTENRGEILKSVEGSSAEESEVNNDFNVSLIDAPADGYEPYSDVKMRVSLNNNTGHDLSDVKVKFTLKKKAKNVNDVMTTTGIREYIQFKDVPVGYNQSATFTGEYATYQIEKQNLGSISEQFTMRLTYPVGNNSIDADSMSKLDSDFMSYGDTEFEVTFTSGDKVLARQNLTLHAKSQNPTYRMTLHKDRDFEVVDVYASSNNPISITNAETRLLWLALSPTQGAAVVDGTKHLTFHLPDGTEFDNERFKKHYPWLTAQVTGRDVSVDVPPYATGTLWTSTWWHRRNQRVSNYYVTPYINIPIKLVGDVHTPYTFLVDGDMSASLTITDKELKRVDPKSLVKPSVSSYNTDNGWVTTVKSDLISRNQFKINSEIVDVKQPGMLLKQLSISDKTAKIYGIKDGKRVELTRGKLTHDPLYYEVGRKDDDFVTGLEVYDKIEVVYDKPTSNSYVGYNFETIDKTKLSTKFPITYNIDDGEIVETNPSLTRYPITHNITVGNGDRKFVNTTSGGLYYTYVGSQLYLTPFYGKYKTYLVYKYEKDMRVTHSDYEELVKREIVGDTVYDLTRVIKTHTTTNEYQIAEFLPSMTDGVHRLTAKAFFNPDEGLPINYINAGIRQPYEHDRSLKDNYVNSTNRENIIDFTYESPKRLQVTALLDGGTRKEVTDVTQAMDFVHYIANKSTQDYKNVVGEVVLPQNMYLTGVPTTDARYKVLYEENGTFVENPSDLASVRKLKIVPKTDTVLHNQDVIETHIPMKLTDEVNYDQRLTIQSKMVYKGLDTKAQDISVFVKDPTLADGKVNVNYVMDGETIKTATITKKHGSVYNVDTTDFIQGGKRYEFDHVDGDVTGTIVGLTTKDVTVYVREKPVVFDLPTTGTLATAGILSSLLGILGVTFVRRRGR